VSCAEGDTGKVYQGLIPFTMQRTELENIARPATDIMLIIGNPEIAFSAAFCRTTAWASPGWNSSSPSTSRPIHGAAASDRVQDADERRKLAELTRNSRHRRVFRAASRGRHRHDCRRVLPKPVIVRMSDFKTNEYADCSAALVRGDRVEPMLGFRGAARYTHPAYAEGFALECAAMRRVRETMGLTNIKLMIPFCRRVEEGSGSSIACANSVWSEARTGWRST